MFKYKSILLLIVFMFFTFLVDAIAMNEHDLEKESFHFTSISAVDPVAATQISKGLMISSEAIAGTFLSKYFTPELVELFDRLLRSNLPIAYSEPSEVEGRLEPPYNLYYNNDGYQDTGKDGVADNKGSPLEEGKDPIGYNLYIPQMKIKAVIVEVYGGGQRLEETGSQCTFYKRNDIKDHHKVLLSQGVAVAQLNLVDLHEWHLIQWQITEELYARIQRSIDKFFKVIKSDPESLSPDLSILKNKPIYLMGSSFGGGITVRHSQLYPHTFNGYINLSGQVDWSQRNVAAADHLTTIMFPDQIDKIKDPILFVYNFDDNRVSLKQLLNFYDKAVGLGKGDLVRLWVNRQGGMMPQREKFGDQTDTLKGHRFPADPKLFNQMMQTMLQFIEYPSNAIAPLHKWRSEKYKNYHIGASRNYLSDTGRFLTDIYMAYKASSAEEKALFESELKELITRKVSTAGSRVWADNIEPAIFKTLFLSRPAKYVLYSRWDQIMQNILPEPGKMKEHLSNMLNLYLINFIPFLKECFPGDDLGDYPPNLIINNEQAQQLAKSYLWEHRSSQMLIDYANANTQAVQSIVQSDLFKTEMAKMLDPNSWMHEEFGVGPDLKGFAAYAEGYDADEFIRNLQIQLLAKINVERGLIRNVWQETAGRVKQTKRPAVELAAAEGGSHPEWDHARPENSRKNQRSWGEFRDEFEAAYQAGDVKKLEELKHSDQPAVVNLNDLGGVFLIYGMGLHNWGILIADAQKNHKS
ncbi:MAG: hypothetical protein K0R52_876 [Alphaproteobacteria bacterium]|nr:hypothetical protein [Alphaproteobacteria bacterium]